MPVHNTSLQEATKRHRYGHFLLATALMLMLHTVAQQILVFTAIMTLRIQQLDAIEVMSGSGESIVL